MTGEFVPDDAPIRRHFERIASAAPDADIRIAKESIRLYLYCQKTARDLDPDSGPRAAYAPSAQQAFNALLFLYRCILTVDVRGLDTVVPARTTPRLPA